METPNYEIMPDKEYCEKKVSEYDKYLTRTSNYVNLVMELAKKEGITLKYQQVVKVRNGYKLDRSIAKFINMAGFAIYVNSVNKT